MSLTHTNFSFSSSHNDSEHQSGSPSNGRTLLTTISLNSVLSYVFGFFTTIFPHSHGHSQGGSGAEGSRDVENGGVIQLQGAAAVAAQPNNAFVVPPPPIVSVGRSTQVAETIMGNQTVIMEAESGAGPPTYVSEETGTHPNYQIIGQHVVGIWVVPTVVGLISGLIQVAVGSRKANPDQKLLLYLCFGISLATSILGIVLFILSIIEWNNPRRGLIIRSIVVVALGSTFVDICVLITFGFIIVQSKAHE